MPVSVYVVTGPSGKQYVGVSKNVKLRWAGHVRRALGSDRRHPFLDAIRKHGPGAFSVDALGVFDATEDALAYEVFEIAARGLNDRARGYNVSRGGEYDCTDGPAKFWREVRSDPARYAKYIENCRAAGLRRAAAGEIDSGPLVAYGKSRTARERWELQHRATRVASKTPKKPGRNNPCCGNADAVRAAYEAQPPSFKKRHARLSRINATALWARRTDDERAEVAAKIAASVRALSADPAYRERNLAGLAKGRDRMDRAVQGEAASRGLKQFWADLRNDPARYAEYISRRRETLLKTLKDKPAC